MHLSWRARTAGHVLLPPYAIAHQVVSTMTLSHSRDPHQRANGWSLACVYVQDEPGGNYDGLTENEARRIAVNARLPELLLKERLGCASAPN